ncbi:hypothetical protein [Streptomyces ipomoeae]|uniref:hypothetical protein n=1 Tax=Streptomyces ipomoeae TaxID=103232 RepID=UPI0029A2D953|nr:hypothetical protein [Streptomyces ipomoeae]MDX2696842.1 hypothetical protein [Streptomyces ipomoeae]MDX2843168.1 hypothetical protein [Streptomyces ipomoeae]
MATIARPSLAATEPSTPIGDYDAVEAFQALTAEHNLRVEEWDTTTLDENLRDKFYAFYLQLKDGTRILVVPTGQDPAQRLHAARALLAHQAVTA